MCATCVGVYVSEGPAAGCQCAQREALPGDIGGTIVGACSTGGAGCRGRGPGGGAKQRGFSSEAQGVLCQILAW